MFLFNFILACMWLRVACGCFLLLVEHGFNERCGWEGNKTVCYMLVWEKISRLYVPYVAFIQGATSLDCLVRSLFEHVSITRTHTPNSLGTMGQKGYVRRETSPQSMYRSTCNSTRNHRIRWNASFKLYLSRCISCFVRHSLVPIRGSSLCLRSIDSDEHSNRVSVVTSSHETILVSLYSACGILTRSRSYNIYTTCIFISAGTCRRQQDMERIRGNGTHATRSDVGCTNSCICICNFSDARCGFYHEACSDFTK